MQEENIREPQEIPGLYWVTGKSECEDFDRKQACQCSGCDIWREHKLDRETCRIFLREIEQLCICP